MKEKSGFRLRRFATTADVGIHVSAYNTADLLRGAARGMFAYMFDLSRIPRQSTSRLAVIAVEAQELPIAFLNELLYLFNALGQVPLNFPELRIERDRIDGIMEWGKLDQMRDRLGGEVKAVTYHLYRWDKLKDGRQRLQVVFDV